MKKHKENLVDVKLSLNEETKGTASDVQKEYLEEEIKEIIPKIQRGKINISGVYTFDNGDKYEVKVYITNGLDQPINFEEVPLFIINSKGDKLAYQVFDLSQMEDIPSYSARPYTFEFNKNNLLVDEIPKDDWKVVFGGEDAQAVKYADIQLEEIPEEMSIKEVNTFREFLSSLPGLEEGQASVSVFTMTQYKNNDILMTLVVRNATRESLTLSKLPVTINTSNGERVLSGVFDVDNFTVNSHKAKILSLVFPNDILEEKEFDLSSCKIIFNKE